MEKQTDPALSLEKWLEDLLETQTWIVHNYFQMYSKSCNTVQNSITFIYSFDNMERLPVFNNTLVAE